MLAGRKATCGQSQAGCFPLLPVLMISQANQLLALTLYLVYIHVGINRKTLWNERGPNPIREAGIEK